MGSRSLELLQRLGLNVYEAKAFSGLAKLGRGTPGDVSRASAIPRARIYDVLDSLEEKGFAVRLATRPASFEARRLQDVKRQLHARKETELRAALQDIHETVGLLEKDLTVESTPEKGTDAAYLLNGLDAIHGKLREEMSLARETVEVYAPAERLAAKKAACAKKIAALKKRGVNVLHRATDARAEKGWANHRFVVFDGKKVLAFLSEPQGDAGKERALFVESPFLARQLRTGKRR